MYRKSVNQKTFGMGEMNANIQNMLMHHRTNKVICSVTKKRVVERESEKKRKLGETGASFLATEMHIKQKSTEKKGD